MRFINDPALGDYFIQVDDLNYSAFLKIIPDSGIPYDSCIGHFSDFSKALGTINIVIQCDQCAPDAAGAQ